MRRRFLFGLSNRSANSNLCNYSKTHARSYLTRSLVSNISNASNTYQIRSSIYYTSMSQKTYCSNSTTQVYVSDGSSNNTVNSVPKQAEHRIYSSKCSGQISSFLRNNNIIATILLLTTKKSQGRKSRSATEGAQGQLTNPIGLHSRKVMKKVIYGELNEIPPEEINILKKDIKHIRHVLSGMYDIHHKLNRKYQETSILENCISAVRQIFSFCFGKIKNRSGEVLEYWHIELKKESKSSLYTTYGVYSMMIQEELSKSDLGNMMLNGNIYNMLGILLDYLNKSYRYDPNKIDTKIMCLENELHISLETILPQLMNDYKNYNFNEIQSIIKEMNYVKLIKLIKNRKNKLVFDERNPIGEILDKFLLLENLKRGKIGMEPIPFKIVFLDGSHRFSVRPELVDYGDKYRYPFPLPLSEVHGLEIERNNKYLSESDRKKDKHLVYAICHMLDGLCEVDPKTYLCCRMLRTFQKFLSRESLQKIAAALKYVTGNMLITLDMNNPTRILNSVMLGSFQNFFSESGLHKIAMMHNVDDIGSAVLKVIQNKMQQRQFTNLNHRYPHNTEYEMQMYNTAYEIIQNNELINTRKNVDIAIYIMLNMKLFPDNIEKILALVNFFDNKMKEIYQIMIRSQKEESQQK